MSAAEHLSQDVGQQLSPQILPEKMQALLSLLDDSWGVCRLDEIICDVNTQGSEWLHSPPSILWWDRLWVWAEIQVFSTRLSTEQSVETLHHSSVGKHVKCLPQQKSLIRKLDVIFRKGCCTVSEYKRGFNKESQFWVWWCGWDENWLLTIYGHPHCLLFIQVRVEGEAALARKPEPSSYPLLPLTHLGGPHGNPKPAERHDVSSMSRLIPKVSSLQDMLETPPQRDISELSSLYTTTWLVDGPHCGRHFHKMLYPNPEWAIQFFSGYDLLENI